MSTSDDGEEKPPEKRKAGRPPNTPNRFSKKARAWAEDTGMLPHEILLFLARGEPICRKIKNTDPTNGEVHFSDDWVAPDLEQMIDCAKAAAPYFAPKFSTVELLTNTSDDDLAAIIASLASEAGVGASFGGASQEEQSEDPPSSGRRRLRMP